MIEAALKLRLFHFNVVKGEVTRLYNTQTLNTVSKAKKIWENSPMKI